jgi:(5-formylfuran-3-yl)methyl phosphate synthase
MQLLVSVADASEAHAALLGGAEVIDAKDPGQGALGAVRQDVLGAICTAVPAGRPVSVALGDDGPPTLIEHRARAAARRGAAFVKVGFRAALTVSQAHRRAAAARRGAGEGEGGAGARVVLVAYADWARAPSLAPEPLVALAADIGAAGVLLDTAFKQAGLFALLDTRTVGAWVAAAHHAGLFACLAGSLGGADFATARALGADLVGVRGAACIGGRRGRVSSARVAALSALARAAPVGAAATLV